MKRIGTGMWLCLLGFVATEPAAPGQSVESLPDLGGSIRFQVTDERTTLDPRTRMLRTQIELEVSNTSDHSLLSPFHLVIQPDSPDVMVEGADGGPDVAPYDTFFQDLSPLFPGPLLPPGESIHSTLVFSRSSRAFLRYSLSSAGNLNQLPEVRDGAPYRVRLGEVVGFDASASTDPEDGQLAFEWRFGDGGSASTAQADHTYAEIGLYHAVLLVSDSDGGVVEQSVPVTVLPNDSFALARTRTLDGEGLPLSGVRVEEEGALGTRVRFSEPSGYLSLGQVAGPHRWLFSVPGYLPVVREADLAAEEVLALPHPWLTRRVDPATATLNPIRATTFAGPAGALRGQVEIGQVDDLGEIFLTPLHAQSLPLPIPPGYSPVQAFWLQTDVGFIQPLALEADLWDVAGQNEAVWLLRFDDDGEQWVVHDQLAAAGRTLAIAVSGPGVWCLVVSDPLSPLPVPGMPMPQPTPIVPDRSAYTASASAAPAQRPASPVADAVRTTGRVDFMHTDVQQSGTAFPITVAETYRLTGDRFRSSPSYDSTLYAYRRPGPEDANALRSLFPLRPQFLFERSELDEAVVHVEAFARSDVTGGVLDDTGGTVQASGVTLEIPPGALAELTAVEIRALDPLLVIEATESVAPVLAFELNIAGLIPGTGIDIQFDGVPPDANLVLARVIADRDLFALEPVLRLTSDVSGAAVSSEPGGGERLPGLTLPGQYVTLQTTFPVAHVFGAVTLPGGDAAGAVVRVDGQPWGTRVGTDGLYHLLADTPEGRVTVSDAETSFEASAIAVGLVPGAPTQLDLLLGPAGPRVLRISPADGADLVSRNESVTAEFSEKVDPVSLINNGMVLLDPQTSAVPASISLSLDGLRATVLPIEPLASSALYTIELASTVQDLQGLPLEGPDHFSFTTEPDPPRGEGAKLVIFEPGSTNCPCVGTVPGYDPALGEIVCVEGGPGTADPGAAVILVNEMDGRTATVTAGPDGSFLNFVEGVEGDFISATFINANGTRITIPVTRQLFDDGRVGLYRAGGILEAESDNGPIQVIVEPSAVEQRTRFRLENFPLQDLLDLLDNTEPDGGQLLAAARYAEEIEGIIEAADISFPIDPADVNLPPGTAPEDATYVLTSPMRIGTNVTYQLIDTMAYEPDGEGGATLTTRSPPFVGLLSRQLTSMRENARVVNTISTVQQTDVGSVFGPVALAGGSDTKVAGTILAGPVDEAGNLVGPAQPVRGAVVALEFVGGPRNPGEFRRGELVYLSDDEGKYVFLVSSEDANRVVTATHPRFPFQVARSSGFRESQEGSIVRTDLLFGIPVFENGELNDVAEPVMSVSHTPVLPGLGEEVLLTVAVADDGQIGPVEVQVEEARTLGAGIDVTDQVQIESVGVETPGPGRVTEQFTIGIQVGARIRLRIFVSDGGGHLAEQIYGIVVAGDQVVFSGTDANDDRGPVVSRAWPPEGSRNIPSLTPIILRFNEPIEPNQVEGTAWLDWGSMGSGHAIYNVRPSPDFREVTIFYAGETEGPVELVVQTTLADVNGNSLDQDPLKDGNQSFTLTFEQAGLRQATVDDISQGGGVALLGRFAYALDRTDDGGRLLSYDLADPVNPEHVDTFEFRGRPTTISAIPSYSLARGVPVDGGSPSTIDCEVMNLLAVFSGGANEDNRLTLIPAEEGDLPDAANLPGIGSFFAPVSAIISISPASTVVKSKWDPPFLGFHELGADVTSVGLVNLQAFHTGYSLNQDERDELPDSPFAGIDANQDGDYCDEEFDEIPPLPPAAANQFFGFEFGFAPVDPDDRISDFDFSADFGLLGIITTRRGGDSGYYETILGGNSGVPLTGARAQFSSGERPRRMLMLPNVLVDTDPQPSLRDLVLVTFSHPAGLMKVIDISIPEFPVVLNSFDLSPDFGAAFSMARRGDGRIAVAMTGGTVILDPFQLLVTESTGIHPSVVDRIPGGGGNVRDFVADDSGINLTTAGGTVQLVQSAPSMHFVTLQSTLDTAEAVAGYPVEDRRTLVERTRLALAGDPMPFAFDAGGAPPPLDPLRHYYVLMDAPGAAGETVQLALVAADARGRMSQPVNAQSLPKALFELTGGVSGVLFRRDYINVSVIQMLKAAGFNNLLEFKDPDAVLKIANIPSVLDKVAEIVGFLLKYPDTIEAYRLSEDPNDSLYNVYLAGPFVLLPEDVDGDGPGQLTLLVDSRLSDLQDQLDRRYIQATPLAWAGLSPAIEDNAVLGHFAANAKVDVDLVSFDAEEFIELTGQDLAESLEEAVASASGEEGILESLKKGLPGLVEKVAEQVDLEGTMVISITPGAHAVMPVNVRQRNPVVLIPGVMGSHLESTSGNFPDAQELLSALLAGNSALSGLFNLGALDSVWIEGALFGTDSLEMDENGNSLQEVRASDIIRKVPSEGRFPLTVLDNIEAIKVDIYHRLIQQLEVSGYVDYDYVSPFTELIDQEKARRMNGDDAMPNLEQSPRPDLFVFPYDWRQPNQVSAEQLEEYVDLVFALHPEASQIDIIGHSMGGLVAGQFITDNPGVVDQCITIGTPWLGAPKALVAMETGDFDDIALGFLIPPSELRKLAQFLPSLHQLLPSRGLFELGLRPLIETGWDANENGEPEEIYSFEDYITVIRDHLFSDDIEEFYGTNAAPESPSAFNHLNFHGGETEDNFFGNWRNFETGVEFHHFFGMTAAPLTINQVALTTWLAPVRPTNETVVLTGTAVDFFESEKIDGSGDRVIVDETPLPVAGSQYRIQRNLQYFYGSGDGTVPLLSASRGAGSEEDFNAPNTRLYPVIEGRSVSSVPRNAEHNGMLLDPIVLQQIVQILDGRIPETLDVSVSVPDGAVEGDTVSISISVSGLAEPGLFGDAVFDFGDGATRSKGLSGSGTSANHVFLDDGTFTVSCGVAFENGQAGFSSRTITVSNAAPQVAIVGENIDTKLSANLYTVEVQDPGLHDRHRFAWSVNGGSFDPSNAFATVVEFPTAGTYQVTVEVEDEDGGLTQADLGIGITETGEVEIANLPDPLPLIGPPESGQPSQQLLLRVTGARPTAIAPDGVQVGQVQAGEGLTSLFGGVSVASYFAQLTGSILRPGFDGGATAENDTVYLNIVKPVEFDILGDLIDYREARVFVHLSALRPFQMQALYIEDGVARSADFIEFNGNPNTNVTEETFTELEYVFNWESRGSAPATIDSQTLPLEVQHFVVGLKANDRSGPDVIGVENEWNDLVYLVGRDNAFPERDLDYFYGFDADGDGDFIAETFFPLTERVFEESMFPVHRTAVIARDPMGNITPPRPFQIEEVRDYQFAYEVDAASAKGGPAGDPEDPDDEEYCAELDAIRAAVQQAISDALLHPVMQQMLLNVSHLWILEQGSGSCLWEPDACAACEEAGYRPGESDNDYEVFLPVFLDGTNAPPFDPNNETNRDAFLAMKIHSDAVMFPSNQWYFTRPIPVDANTDPTTDPIPFAYRYTVPPGLAGTNSSTFFLDHSLQPLSLSNLSADISNAPLTPAEIISFVLEETVRENPALRMLLPDVNFFPFRREHFMYGAMSLERPPTHGDDTLGDAGMGRGLLLLKWLIEGAYVDVPGISPGADFGGVYQNLRMRGISDAEAFEWGVLQELAWVSASARLDLSMQPLNDNAPSTLLENFMQKRRRLILRKAGKAGLRAGLSQLLLDPADTGLLLPPTLAEAREAGTFEDHAATAILLGMMPTLGTTVLDLRDAKKGDDQLFDNLDRRGYQNLVLAASDIIEATQAAADATYMDYLQRTGQPGGPTGAEIMRRCDNMRFLLAELRSRKQLNLEAPLTFALHNLTDVPETLEVTLSIGATQQSREAVLTSGETEIMQGEILPAGSEVPFVILRSPLQVCFEEGTLTVESTAATFEPPTPQLQEWTIESEVLPETNLVPPFDEEAALRDLLVVDLFFDPEFTRPVTDHPAADGRPRSPRFLITKEDRLYLRVVNCGTAPLGTVTATFTTEAGTESGPIPLERVADNVFANTGTPMRVDFAFDPAEPAIPLLDEEVITFDVETSSGPTGSRDIMLDRAEFAAGGLQFMYDGNPPLTDPGLPPNAEANARAPMLRSMITNGNFWLAGDETYHFRWGTNTIPNELTAFIQNTGAAEPFDNESDLFAFVSHGQSDGSFYDHPQIQGQNNLLIFDPDDPVHGIDNELHWNSDTDWAYTPVCLTLSHPGTQVWVRAMQGADRPVHMVLGAKGGMSPDANARFLLFSELTLEQGRPILDAYREAMETSDTDSYVSSSEPWAVLYYESARNDTLRELSPDPRPGDRILYASHDNPDIHPCRDADPTTPTRSVGPRRCPGHRILASLDGGMGSRLVDWETLAQPAEPIFTSITIRQTANSATPASWRRYTLRNGTLGFEPRLRKDAAQVVALSKDEATVMVRRFASQNWPEVNLHVHAPRVTRHTVSVIDGDDVDREWVSGYRVEYPLTVSGIPVAGGHLTAYIEGESLTSCYLRDAEVVPDGRSRRAPVMGPKESWERALPAVHVELDLRDRYAIADAQLLYAMASNPAAAPDLSGGQYVPAWRFVVFPEFDEESHGARVELWVDAVTGELLDVRGEAIR